eukprot:gene4820-6484_t
MSATGLHVLFSSDHGFHLGQFRIPAEKMLPYETDVRVPLYISGPGIAPGTLVPELVANIAGSRGIPRCDTRAAVTDIAPTLIDLAGIAVPPALDGRSLAPLLTARARAAAATRR